MSFTITIDKRKVLVDEGCTLIDAAADNGVFIPNLCYTRGKPCLGTCRVCSVRVNGKVTAACTVPVQPGMVVDVNEPEVAEMRKLLVEALFSEGNHNCPSCEKSGRCELQAVAYEVEMTASPFPYRFPKREREDAADHIFLERDRCIFCQRCVEHVRDEETGQAIFAIHGRGTKARIEIDVGLANKLTPEQVHAAAELCPVGCILEKGVGFEDPMGSRKFDVKSLRRRMLEGETS
ncbi:MAG TPA: NADP oxidoreductase [Rhodobacteraceae bacterium]|nr:NADP oxidoreductase [Paracoccaceae bacterium]